LGLIGRKELSFFFLPFLSLFFLSFWYREASHASLAIEDDNPLNGLHEEDVEKCHKDNSANGDQGAP
jgi:hypothetical protein